MTINFDFATLSAAQRYKLLCGLVVPRPIALITTISDAGIVNAAPFSFFNVFSEKPPLVIVGLQAKSDLSLKDTTRNVRANGLFVINMVDEALAGAMVDCSIGFPADVGEPEALQLPMAAGVHVAVPHLAGAPAALECRKVTLMNFGAERDLLVGEVLGIQVRDGVVDPETLRTDYEQYLPVGRVAGTMYARMQDRFEIKPDTFETWQARGDR
ncbi:flavin reductase family protein [Tardiphaga sp.]|jgi:flavin reductase (DIM6/NTAB) family NADH-FMN oxidoreductase RutF|uniref:flavin reductase family protein n=1 Tax=Tardiphaga sp. TaxID=1926292 RepID=UPI00199FC38C|nr:flavin reductase family protein [Tardiphaga sp.]MBC7580384.1 flavin reductase family protein [Tardiphaga sp.]